jgi:hypothetical protein
MTTRREFLIGSADLMAIAAMAPACMLYGPAEAAPPLRLADFKALLHQHFTLIDPNGGNVDMILLKIIVPKTKQVAKQVTEQFSLLFYAGHRENYQSGTYQLSNSRIGTIDMHLYVVGANGAGEWYRADFNLLVA